MKIILDSSTVKRSLAAIFLCACLGFLTTVNFFLYPKSATTSAYQQDGNNQPFPLEEKSPSTNTSIIQEEYLHHPTCIPPVYYQLLTTLYHQSNHEQLPVVHFDLVSPPPKS